MTDESRAPSSPDSIAARLLAAAESKPELRRRLVELWARADSWTLVEGIALAWTLDPANLGKAELLRRKPEYDLPNDAWHYLELSRRSVTLLTQRVTPSAFIEWAHATALAFHPDWIAAVNRRASEIAQYQAQQADLRRQQLIQLWVRSPYWSPEEGVALAFDLDPDKAIVRNANGHDEPVIRAPAEARQLLVVARRAVESGRLDKRAAPIVFLAWSRSMNAEFHADWSAAVSEWNISGPQAPALPAPAVPELKTRERETLLKLVVGMAVKGYGWNPRSARNDATAEIAGDLEQAGVSLDADTIRKWLRIGANELLPGGDD